MQHKKSSLWLLKPAINQAFGYPHLIPRRGRPKAPPGISKTIATMNVKFCRILETSLNVKEAQLLHILDLDISILFQMSQKM